MCTSSSNPSSRHTHLQGLPNCASVGLQVPHVTLLTRAAMKSLIATLYMGVLTYVCTVTALDGQTCFEICYKPAVEEQCPAANLDCVCKNEQFLSLLNMCIQRTCQESLYEAEAIHETMC
ncbi:hypothetical protein J3F83DRAFT_742588, partial [Trichoderma novae-zelandiae]